MVSVVALKGLPGSARVACLEVAVVMERPPGVLRVALLTTGACIPKRGSGPCVSSMVVPSGVTTFLVPSALINFSVFRPLGSVFVRRLDPSGRLSTSYVFLRPEALAALVVKSSLP